MVSTPFRWGHGRRQNNASARTADKQGSSRSRTASLSAGHNNNNHHHSNTVRDAEQLLSRAVRWCRRRKLPHRPSALLQETMLQNMAVDEEDRQNTNGGNTPRLVVNTSQGGSPRMRNENTNTSYTAAGHTCNVQTNNASTPCAGQRARMQSRRLMQAQLAQQLISTACRAQSWYSTVCDEVNKAAASGAAKAAHKEHCTNKKEKEMEEELPALLHRCCYGHAGRRSWSACCKQSHSSSQPLCWTSTRRSATRSEYLFVLGQSIIRGILITFPSFSTSSSSAVAAELFDVADRLQYTQAVCQAASPLSSRPGQKKSSSGSQADTPLANLSTCKSAPTNNNSTTTTTTRSKSEQNIHGSVATTPACSPRKTRAASSVSFVTAPTCTGTADHTANDDNDNEKHENDDDDEDDLFLRRYACIEALNAEGACVVHVVLTALAPCLHPALFSGILVGLVSYGVHTWQRTSLTSGSNNNNNITLLDAITNGVTRHTAKRPEQLKKEASGNKNNNNDSDTKDTRELEDAAKSQGEAGKSRLSLLPALWLPRRGEAEGSTTLNTQKACDGNTRETPVKQSEEKEEEDEEEGADKQDGAVQQDHSGRGSGAHSQQNTAQSARSLQERQRSARYGSMQSRKRRRSRAVCETTVDMACWALHTVLLVLLMRVHRVEERLLQLSHREAKADAQRRTNTKDSNSDREAVKEQQQQEQHDEPETKTDTLQGASSKSNGRRNKLPSAPLDLQMILSSYQSSMAHSLDANYVLDQTSGSPRLITREQHEKDVTARETDFAQLLINARSVLSVMSFFVREEAAVRAALPSFAQAFVQFICPTEEEKDKQGHTSDHTTAAAAATATNTANDEDDHANGLATLLSKSASAAAVVPLGQLLTPHLPSTTTPTKAATGAAMHARQIDHDTIKQPSPRHGSHTHRTCDGQRVSSQILAIRERSTSVSPSADVKEDPPYTIQQLHALCGLQGWSEPLAPPLLRSLLVPHLACLFTVFSNFHTQWRLIDQTENQIALKMNLLFAFDIPTLLALRTVARMACDVAPLRVNIARLAEGNMVLYKVLDVLDCQLLQSSRLYLNTDPAHWLQPPHDRFMYCATMEDDEERVVWEVIAQRCRGGTAMGEAAQVIEKLQTYIKEHRVSCANTQASSAGPMGTSFYYTTTTIINTPAAHTNYDSNTNNSISRQPQEQGMAAQSKSALLHTGHANKGDEKEEEQQQQHKQQQRTYSGHTSSSLPNLTDTMHQETYSRHANSDGCSGASTRGSPLHAQKVNTLVLTESHRVSLTEVSSAQRTRSTSSRAGGRSGEQAVSNSNNNTATSTRDAEEGVRSGVAVKRLSVMPSPPPSPSPHNKHQPQQQQQQPRAGGQGEQQECYYYDQPQPPSSQARPGTNTARRQSLTAHHSVHLLHSAPSASAGATANHTRENEAKEENSMAGNNNNNGAGEADMLPASYLINISQQSIPPTLPSHQENVPVEGSWSALLSSHVHDPPMLLAANRLTMDTEFDEPGALDTFRAEVAAAREMLANASMTSSSSSSSSPSSSAARTSSSSCTMSLVTSQSSSSAQQQQQRRPHPRHPRPHHRRRYHRHIRRGRAILLPDAAHALQASPHTNSHEEGDATNTMMMMSSMSRSRRMLGEPYAGPDTTNTRSSVTNLIGTSRIPQCAGYVGLLNMGNTCFMNSVVQLLFRAEWFVHDLLQRRFLPFAATYQDEKEPRPEAGVNNSGSSYNNSNAAEIHDSTAPAEQPQLTSNSARTSRANMPNNMTEVALYLLLGEMYWRIHRHQPPCETFYIQPHFFTRHVPEPFDDGRQHDASEFAKALLTILDEEESKSRSQTAAEVGEGGRGGGDEEGGENEASSTLPRASPSTADTSNTNSSSTSPAAAAAVPTIVHRWFGGTLATTIECLMCHSLRTRTSEFWDVTVPILSDRALEELDSYNNNHHNNNNNNNNIHGIYTNEYDMGSNTTNSEGSGGGGGVEANKENSNKNGFILVGPPTEPLQTRSGEHGTSTGCAPARPLRTTVNNNTNNTNTNNNDHNEHTSAAEIHEESGHDEHEGGGDEVDNKRGRLLGSSATHTSHTTVVMVPASVAQVQEMDSEREGGGDALRQHTSQTNRTQTNNNSNNNTNKTGKHLYGADNILAAPHTVMAARHHRPRLRKAAATNHHHHHHHHHMTSDSKPHTTHRGQQHQQQQEVATAQAQLSHSPPPQEQQQESQQHHVWHRTQRHHRHRGSPRSFVERRQSANIQIETVYAQVPSSSASSSSSSASRHSGRGSDDDEEMMSAHTPTDGEEEDGEENNNNTLTSSSSSSSSSSSYSSRSSLLSSAASSPSSLAERLPAYAPTSINREGEHNNNHYETCESTHGGQQGPRHHTQAEQAPAMKLLTWHTHNDRTSGQVHSSDAVHMMLRGSAHDAKAHNHNNNRNSNDDDDANGSLLLCAHTAPAVLPGSEAAPGATSPPHSHEIFSLQDLLDKTLDPQSSSEVLDAESRLECEHCGRRTVTELRTMVLTSPSPLRRTDSHIHEGTVGSSNNSNELPYYLTVQLNRFRYNRHTQTREKITHGVRLEPTLRLPVMSSCDVPSNDERNTTSTHTSNTVGTAHENDVQGCAQARHASQSETSAGERHGLWWQRVRRVPYTLRAIIIHSGSTPDSGHYFTLVRHNECRQGRRSTAHPTEVGERSTGKNEASAAVHVASSANASTHIHNTKIITSSTSSSSDEEEEEEDEAQGWVTLNDSAVQPVQRSVMQALLRGEGGIFGSLETPYILLYERVSPRVTLTASTEEEEEGEEVGTAVPPPLHFPAIIEHTFANNLTKMTQPEDKAMQVTLSSNSLVGPMGQPGVSCEAQHSTTANNNNTTTTTAGVVRSTEGEKVGGEKQQLLLLTCKSSTS